MKFSQRKYVLPCLIAVAAVVASFQQPASAEVDLQFEERRMASEQMKNTASSSNELERLRLESLDSELHYLQLQIERFSVDHRIGDEPGEYFYPASLSLLVNGGCCEEHGQGGYYIAEGLYPNPWKAGSADELNAMQVPLGWTEQAVGNFSYACQYDNSGRVVTYALVGWGPEQVGGLDIDGDGRGDGAELFLTNGAFRGPDGWVYAWDDALQRVELDYLENGRRISLVWKRENEQ